MILVFGKTGQVAQALARRSDPSMMFLDRAAANLAHPGSCAAAIHNHRPQAVINAAAYTQVDQAEGDEALATQINGMAPDEMAQACAALDIPLVHLSTDYVFDGSGTAPFAPDTPLAPLGAYGRSKARGEAFVQAAQGRYAILRVSWVFSSHGQNFVKTMLRLGASNAELRVVADQIGGPTPAQDIALACHTLVKYLLADPTRRGIWHLSGAPDVSWADFAREIMAQAGLPCEILDCPTSAYPTPAPRPQNSRLDCADLGALGLCRPDWRDGVRRVLGELGVRDP